MKLIIKEAPQTVAVPQINNRDVFSLLLPSAQSYFGGQDSDKFKTAMQTVLQNLATENHPILKKQPLQIAAFVSGRLEVVAKPTTITTSTVNKL